MRRRFLITVEYDGKNYCGWQRQRNGTGVQAVIEDALYGLFGNAITLFGSGRTDAGVSAEEQTAHFDADTDIPPERIPHALNFRLPRDISVKSCRVVGGDFHARSNKKKKTYVYKLYVSDVRRPLLDRDRLFIKKPLDIESMRRAAELMVGVYDCRCYEKSGSAGGNPVKTVYSAAVGDLGGGRLDIAITGSGFLYKMARTMAGTLVYVGIGKLTAEDVGEAVKNCDKIKTGKTLPAEFLRLVKTEYIDAER
ncbi:MAG: tRNA pseudouridine(38-40) synthase TruA [Clostridiales bacterium]|jgi:tRNA pseudouridine38-40 synthase|nr:tRNA pseudouridine(38-40) synthase TruA [Clostridiales bacterium]